jgi:hypothetical protein
MVGSRLAAEMLHLGIDHVLPLNSAAARRPPSRRSNLSKLRPSGCHARIAVAFERPESSDRVQRFRGRWALGASTDASAGGTSTLVSKDVALASGCSREIARASSMRHATALKTAKALLSVK